MQHLKHIEYSICDLKSKQSIDLRDASIMLVDLSQRAERICNGVAGYPRC